MYSNEWHTYTLVVVDDTAMLKVINICLFTSDHEEYTWGNSIVVYKTSLTQYQVFQHGSW